MEVVIIGPNLPDQSKGQFHVHKAGCADTKKAEYKYHKIDLKHPIKVNSVQEVVEFVYCDILDEDDANGFPSTWQTYSNEFHFFPCTNNWND